MTHALTAAPYARTISGTEKAWVAAEHVHGAFVNQLVLEGDEAVPAARWREAMAVAAQANPGARVAWRGALGWARWVDTGITPPVREVDGSAWDGRSGEGAPFLSEGLDPVLGPSTLLLVVSGPRPRVVLRTCHATMDGGGTLAFATDLLRALRGDAPSGHRDVSVDTDLARDVAPLPPSPEDAVAATGDYRAGSGVRWCRRSVDTPSGGLLGRALGAVAQMATTQGVPVRLHVPADLRRQRPDVASTANLTGLVALDVAPGTSDDDLHRAVRAAIDAGEPDAAVRGVDVVRHVPLWLARWVGRRGLTRARRTGRFGASAVVSNVGRLDADALSGGGWTTTRAWMVPPCTPATPAFVVLTGGAWGADVVVGTPVGLGSDGRLEALADAVADAISAR